jgi:hypothetical protein
LAIYPASGFLAVAKALESVYASIQQGKGTKPLEAHLYPFEKLCVLMGFQEVWDFDAKYAEDKQA